MSLKAFHLFFISLSVLLALGTGLWALNAYTIDPTPGYLVLAAISFVGGGALVVYEVKFWQRTKTIGL